MSGVLAAAFAFLFFAPLAFIYGRALAVGTRRKARACGRSPLSLFWPKLVLPALVGPAMLYRLTAHGTSLEPRIVATGSAVLDAGLGLVDLVGSLAAIVFFLTIPFVMGRLFAAMALGLGYFAGDRSSGLQDGERDGKASPGEAKAAPRGDGPLTTGRLTIAIDGPAAAGKGTLAKRLSSHYGLPYLDTGLLYRAVGKRAAQEGVDLDDPVAAGAVARALPPSALDDGSLRGREAGELASRVAVHPQVRAALESFQREFAGRAEGAVLDGRDIGTVIAPTAQVKIFVTASPEVRARRRTDELGAKGRPVDYERILAEVRERDARDAGREAAPLKPAADAHLLDTSEMDIDAAFRAACELIDRVLSARNGV